MEKNVCGPSKITYKGRCPNTNCMAFSSKIDSGCILHKVDHPSLYSIGYYKNLTNKEAKRFYKKGLHLMQEASLFYHTINAEVVEKVCDTCNFAGCKHEKSPECMERRKFCLKQMRRYPFFLIKSRRLFWRVFFIPSLCNVIKESTLVKAKKLMNQKGS